MTVFARSRRFFGTLLMVLAVGGTAFSQENLDDAQPPVAPPVVRAPSTITIIGPDGQPFHLNFNDPRLSGAPTMLKALERRHVLGVATVPVQKGLHGHLGITPDTGLLVTRVAEGSAAESVGIQVNDILLEVDGVALLQTGDLINKLRATQDNPVKLLMLRSGQRLELTATPKLGEDQPALAPLPQDSAEERLPAARLLNSGRSSLEDLLLIHPGMMLSPTPQNAPASELQLLRQELDAMKLQQQEILKKLDEALKR